MHAVFIKLVLPFMHYKSVNIYILLLDTEKKREVYK